MTWMLISVSLQSLQQYHMPQNSLYEFFISNWTGRVNNDYEHAYNLLLSFNGIFPCQRGSAGYPLVLSSICSVNQLELISCCHHMIIYVNVHFCFVSAKLQTDLKNCSVRKTSPELQPPPTSPPTKKQRTSLFGYYSLNAQQDPVEKTDRAKRSCSATQTLLTCQQFLRHQHQSLPLPIHRNMLFCCHCSSVFCAHQLAQRR